MIPVKRLEIVVDALVLSDVTTVLSEEGVSGWTVLRDVRGKGSRGERAADEVTDVMSNVLVLVACAPEQALSVAHRLRPLLTRHGGLLLLSDAQSLIH